MTQNSICFGISAKARTAQHIGISGILNTASVHQWHLILSSVRGIHLQHFIQHDNNDAPKSSPLCVTAAEQRMTEASGQTAQHSAVHQQMLAAHHVVTLHPVLAYPGITQHFLSRFYLQEASHRFLWRTPAAAASQCWKLKWRGISTIFFRRQQSDKWRSQQSCKRDFAKFDSTCKDHNKLMAVGFDLLGQARVPISRLIAIFDS